MDDASSYARRLRHLAAELWAVTIFFALIPPLTAIALLVELHEFVRAYLGWYPDDSRLD